MDGASFPMQLRPGDHICEFYRSHLDLAETLVPYFKEGLERNESCVWITAKPFEVDRAIAEMRAAVSDADQRMASGQLMICNFDEWYVKQGAFDADEVIRSWIARKEDAVRMGRLGLRISGNASFVPASMWNDFVAYERAIDTAFRDQPITTLCSYDISNCSGQAVMDVLGAHSAGLVKQHGAWTALEATVAGHARSFARPGGVPVRWVLDHELAHYIQPEPSRIAIRGGDVLVRLSDAARLAVVVREMAASSARSGALGRGDRIAIHWGLERNGSQRLRLTWTESGGNPLALTDDVEPGMFLMAANCDHFTRTFDDGNTIYMFALQLNRERAERLLE
jgi:hypothetical protein